MIYLLCFILFLCGEQRWVILALRLYKEVKRINKQKETIIPYPCKRCGKYPFIVPDGDIRMCKCYHLNFIETSIKFWNERYGTLDELELKTATIDDQEKMIIQLQEEQKRQANFLKLLEKYPQIKE